MGWIKAIILAHLVFLAVLAVSPHLLAEVLCLGLEFAGTPCTHEEEQRSSQQHDCRASQDETDGVKRLTSRRQRSRDCEDRCRYRRQHERPPPLRLPKGRTCLHCQHDCQEYADTDPDPLVGHGAASLIP